MSEDIQSYAGGLKAFHDELPDRSSQTQFLPHSSAVKYGQRCRLVPETSYLHWFSIGSVLFLRTKEHVTDVVRVHILAS